MKKDMLVRCFSCQAVCTVRDLTRCAACGTGVCGSKATGCNARCVCTSLHHMEHSEDAKEFYATLDQLNAGADPSRVAALESHLEALEQRHGW